MPHGTKDGTRNMRNYALLIFKGTAFARTRIRVCVCVRSRCKIVRCKLPPPAFAPPHADKEAKWKHLSWNEVSVTFTKP